MNPIPMQVITDNKAHTNEDDSDCTWSLRFAILLSPTLAVLSNVATELSSDTNSSNKHKLKSQGTTRMQ